MHSVVSNSTPLIHLAKLNLLLVLKKLYSKVFIPRLVYREVIEEGKYFDKEDARLIEYFIDRFIFVKEANESLKKSISEKYTIHLGESETIALCKDLKLDFILIDESEGRKVA